MGSETIPYVHSRPVTRPDTLVELTDVTVSAGPTTLLRGVDFSVEPGEAVGIFGANGAGKTTLLRLVATLLRPASGDGMVLGAPLGSSDVIDVRPAIGYVGHIPGLVPELTLIENLVMHATLQRRDATEARDALEAVGLGGAADRRAERCSHGMQRRTEFARILMSTPELLLLDEPHSALDQDAVDLVDALVERTVASGGAAVLVSHDRASVKAVASRTAEIVDGRLQ